MSIQTTAKEASSWFTRIKRNDNEEIVTLKEGRPDWVQDLVHKAHGDMMPDDFRYSIIEEAIDAIAEADTDADLDEVGDEYADNVDIYTSDLTAWLHSRNDRADYVDQAIEEYGVSDDADTIKRLSMGQYMERREVFALVREGLEQAATCDELLTDTDGYQARCTLQFGVEHSHHDATAREAVQQGTAAAVDEAEA